MYYAWRFLEIYSIDMCKRVGHSFSIHSLPSSVAVFEVSGGREPSHVLKSVLRYMFHELYPGIPSHRWVRQHIYVNADACAQRVLGNG
jgi:hypothetical protein